MSAALGTPKISNSNVYNSAERVACEKEIIDGKVTTFDQANKCYKLAARLFKNGGEIRLAVVSKLFLKATTYAEAQEKRHPNFPLWCLNYASFFSKIGNYNSYILYKNKAEALTFRRKEDPTPLSTAPITNLKNIISNLI
mgnify:CR=1 FL=1